MLYDEIESYIKNYMMFHDEFDWENFLDELEQTVQKIFPSDTVDIWTYEVDNDTFEIDRAFRDTLEFAKDTNIIDYSVNWDDNMHENLIITIITKGKDNE